jgi:LacI family transcriptional regulator
VLTVVGEVKTMLHDCGVRVPEDTGLASLNVLDSQIDAGINQNAEEIGRVAVLTLISLIQDNDRGIPPIPREILIKGRWVDGSSLPQRAQA